MSRSRKQIAGLLFAALLATGASAGHAWTHASPAAPRASGEYLYEVLRDWREARQRGPVDTKTRLALAGRAFAVADQARGRERYEALRFIAGLEIPGDSSELLSARDRALSRVIAEYIDDGDIMGEFVLRVLRDDDHDRALRAQVSGLTQSGSVRAACEFQAIEATLERALESGELAAGERERALACLARIASEYPAAKHPLSAKTWGEFASASAASLRDLVVVGEPAPEIVGIDGAGQDLRLSMLRGKAVLLCFWGDWCSPCRALYPVQRALQTRFAARPFALLGVNSDPAPATVAEVSAREKLAWPNLWDGVEGTSGSIASRWRIRVWPTWYLIDAEGIVRRSWRGAPDFGELDAAIEAWIPTLRR